MRASLLPTRSTQRTAAVVTAFLLLAAGCVHNKTPGAGVQAITTDLQYKQLQQKNAAPPNTVPPPTGPLLPSQPTIQPFAPNGFGPPLGATNISCPTAAPTAEAQQDVTDTITSLPAPGRYLWRVMGTQIYQGHPLDLPRYTHKSVQNVVGSASNSSQNFTYVTEEREVAAIGAGTVRSSWSVTSSTASDRTVSESQSGQSVSSGRTSTAGLRLTRVARSTPTGGVAVFAPSQPIRYLIAPVIIGPDHYWQDSVVDATSDPSNPQSLRFKAFVKDRVTIDACGERLRGWLVTADSTYSYGGNSVTRHYEYGVATQMGGIIVYEYVKSPCTQQANGTCSEGKPTLEFKSNYGKKE